MFFPQQATSTGAQKRARGEAHDPGDEILDNHICKYQAASSPPTGYCADGVGIGNNSAVTQGKWQIPPVSQLAQIDTAKPQFCFSEILPPSQLVHATGIAPTRPIIIQGDNGAHGAKPPFQPITPNAFSFRRFEGQPSCPPSTKPRNLVRSSAPGHPDPRAAAAADLRQRAAHKLRVLAAVSAQPGYNAHPSGASGQQLAKNGVNTANTEVGPNGHPSIQKPQYSASNVAPNQPYPQPLPNQASTSSQLPTYQPTKAEIDWYKTASCQLANPFHYIPRIPINSILASKGSLLHPYEVLWCRSMKPDERYRQYVAYSNILASLYGPFRTPNAEELKTRLWKISAYLREQEGQYLRLREAHIGDVRRFKLDCDQIFPLELYGMGPADYLLPLGSPALVASQQSYAQNIPSSSAAPLRQSQRGTSPAIYLPNPNRASHQAAAGPQNGYLSSTFSHLATRYSPPVVAGVDQHSVTLHGVLPSGQLTSAGYQNPTAAFPCTIAAEQQQRSALRDNQRSVPTYGTTFSAPIVINDKDGPVQVCSSYIRPSASLNAGVKRRRSDEEVRLVKATRTASYTKPIDITDDNDKAAKSLPLQALSPATEASAPARQTFAKSDNTKEFEAFEKVWNQEKQQVDAVGKRIGSLPETLRDRVTRGDFRYKDAWLAFAAKLEMERQRRLKLESARRSKLEKNERLKAQREARQSSDAKVKRGEEAKAKAPHEDNKRRNAKQKVRQDQRRLQQEAEEKEANENVAQAQKEKEERKAAAREEEERELAELLRAGLDERTEDIAPPNGLFNEVASVGDNEDEKQGRLTGNGQDGVQETSISPNVNSTETTSQGDKVDVELESLFEGDNDEVNSLFDGEDNDSETPATALEYDETTSTIAIAEIPKTIAFRETTITSSFEFKDTQDEKPQTAHLTEEVPEQPTAEDSDGEEDNSDDEEQDREILAKYANMRLVDAKIEELLVQHSNTTNMLFKKKVQTRINSFIEQKQALQNEITKLIQDKKMAQVEEESGL
ncbi:hypothetical protein PMIN03_011499 [Paraphaeosphaeria minitans]|uniref:Uncharacterized protein n=1 Tax=Paraphaeosphaeria minitans TaxID=565426 RepID=A0A9P6GGV3_9PLEO|nr:hypothetical protein PMIN01_06331 [Paraphaeosphaeria minitans]